MRQQDRNAAHRERDETGRGQPVRNAYESGVPHAQILVPSRLLNCLCTSLFPSLWISAIGITADAEDAGPEAALLLLRGWRWLLGNDRGLRRHFSHRRWCGLLSDDNWSARTAERNAQRPQQVRAVNGADVDRLGSAREVLGIDDAIFRTAAIIGCQTAARAVDFDGDDSGRRPERLGLVVLCGGHHEPRP